MSDLQPGNGSGNRLPPPLVSPETDLRDFRFMPLDVVRFTQSDLVSTADAEAVVAAIRLWAASWHQVPAASLSDDDRTLAQLAGYGRAVSAWLNVKQEALRGFIKCSDGRLYHPVVAEKAREAWLARLRQRHRTHCASIRKQNERQKTAIPSPTFEEWLEHGRPSLVTRDDSAPSQHLLPIVTRDNGQNGVACHANVARDEGSKGRDREGKGDSIEKVPNGTVISTAKPPTLLPEHVIEVWNEVAARLALPQARLTDKRRAQIKARIREYQIDDFIAALLAIERSSFLRGDNERGWRADFDFFIRPSNFVKLIEGSYDRQTH